MPEAPERSLVPLRPEVRVRPADPVALALPSPRPASLFTVEVPTGGGGWAADLATPAHGFAFWSGDVEFSGTLVSFYDSELNLLGTFDLLDVGGGNGPFVYGFNGFLSDGADISHVEVTIDPADAVWFDDVQFGAQSTASVPNDAPASAVSTWGRMKASFRR